MCVPLSRSGTSRILDYEKMNRGAKKSLQVLLISHSFKPHAGQRSLPMYGLVHV